LKYGTSNKKFNRNKAEKTKTISKRRSNIFLSEISKCIFLFETMDSVLVLGAFLQTNVL
jgi:hypothetical protein